MILAINPCKSYPTRKAGSLMRSCNKGGLLLGGPLTDEKESSNWVFSDMANKIPTFSNIHQSFWTVNRVNYVFCNDDYCIYFPELDFSEAGRKGEHTARPFKLQYFGITSDGTALASLVRSAIPNTTTWSTDQYTVPKGESPKAPPVFAHKTGPHV